MEIVILIIVIAEMLVRARRKKAHYCIKEKIIKEFKLKNKNRSKKIVEMVNNLKLQIIMLIERIQAVTEKYLSMPALD